LGLALNEEKIAARSAAAFSSGVGFVAQIAMAAPAALATMQAATKIAIIFSCIKSFPPRLAIGVAHFEPARDLLDGPGPREAASGHHLRLQQKGASAEADIP
jgi:hypothetical protein